MPSDVSTYGYASTRHSHAHAILLPVVESELNRLGAHRVFDLGCGNGSTAHHLHQLGYDVTGVDPSTEGVAQAQQLEGIRIEQGSGYDDLASIYGTFDAVISLEVVEHLYAPRDFARTLYNLVEPGGAAIVSTPYHGYWKNLALAVLGVFDRHHNPLWDHGHIKFWSRDTLTKLLEEVGFEVERFHRIGRIPPLAKGMIVTARKPR